MGKFYKYLDRFILPWPVKFLTNPLVILFTFVTLIPLIGFANAVVFVLIVNSYMNVTSVGVSSIVLRQTSLVADSQEARAKQDHETLLAEFTKLQEMQESQVKELEQLKEMNAELHAMMHRSEEQRAHMIDVLHKLPRLRSVGVRKL
ncbi:MAG: hypothetical protein ACYCYO_07450 [Bacilli bacterium]